MLFHFSSCVMCLLFFIIIIIIVIFHGFGGYFVGCNIFSLNIKVQIYTAYK